MLLFESKMGKLNIKIDEKLDNKFRKEVFKRKGMKKGNLTKAVEEAMLLWISSGVVEKKEKV
jgi:hypothetical protein